ncbi:helix-turn-helix domain-containing protein [Amycolatopsis granulosa]|uniref:AraC-like ligand-binding domain-containing protein n=1 Tax=Amycolatopsis granulosa TaxID=185684 RepID=UPI001422321D|nr:AraC-like DNA-binding protein [Amycolatopsis granulosa]
MSVVDVADLVRGRGARLLVGTDRVEAVVDACASTVRPHTLRVRDRSNRLAARLECVTSGAISMSRLSYGADVTISEAAPEQDEFILALPVAGQSRFTYSGATALLGPGAMSVVSPYSKFRLDIDGGFDQVLVRFDRRRVEQAAGSLTGAAGLVPVHFSLAASHATPSVLNLIEAALRMAFEPGSGGPRSRLASQLESVLIETLLLVYPSNLTARLGGMAESLSAQRVAQAMEYMVANLSEPFPLSAVAHHCGVTLRSLQAGFRRELGMSPGEWLRAERLDRAYAQLSAADPDGVTVTATALSCGFVHLGDFAARFRSRFGEVPSAVLRRPPYGTASSRT